MHSAAPELAPRGVERGLIGTIVISALVHAAAIGLLIAMPRRFLSAPPRLQSYTVDLVAPDVIGGTNLVPGGGTKKPMPAKVEPEPGEPAAEAGPPMPPPAAAPPEAVPPPPKPAEPPKPVEAAKPVEPPKPPPPPAVEQPAKPPPPPPKPVEAKPPPKPVEAKPPEPQKPAEAVKPKPVAETKPVAKPPPAPPAKAAPPEKPPPAKPVEKPAEAAAKPPPKQAAKPEPKAEAKPDAKAKPEPAPAKPAAEKAAKPDAKAKPVDEAQQRDQAINAAVAKRAAETNQRDAAAKAADERIAAAVQKRAQQLEKGGSGAAGAGGPIAAGPGTGVGGTPTDMQYILYEGRMRERIKSLWAWTGADHSLSVDVEFKIAPDGQISSVRTVRSSGDASFDASTERAIRAANPLEPVPEKYRDAFARVTLTFQASELEP